MNHASNGATPIAPTPRLPFNDEQPMGNVLLRPHNLNDMRIISDGQDTPPSVKEEEEPVSMKEEVPTGYSEPVDEKDPYQEPSDAGQKIEAADIINKKDLEGLSVEDLRKQQELLAKAIAERQQAEKKAVIDQILDVMKTYSIPIEDLVDAFGGIKTKRKGVKAKLKYQDPVTGATWSGRGKEPSWIKGKDRKDFLIS